YVYVFFFSSRRRHTRFSRDWSSDVCSSDLLSSSSSVSYTDGGVTKTLTTSAQYDGWGRVIQSIDRNNGQVNTSYDVMGRVSSRKIGRASCRERVEGSVGGRLLKSRSSGGAT